MNIFNLTQLVKEAGDILLSIREEGEFGTSLCEERKADGTLVTRADFASNEHLLLGLCSHFPNIAVVSEENFYPATEYSSHFLIIDPLDGTQVYSDGLDEFSILIGEVRDGEPYSGIMHFPALKRTLLGSKEAQATMNNARIEVSSQKTLKEASVSCRKCGDSSDSRVIAQELDSGFALMQLATGQIDGVVIRMITHREWDIVAPTAVILAAGGMVSDESGSKITYQKKGIGFKFFVASNGHCHREILNMIPQLL